MISLAKIKKSWDQITFFRIRKKKSDAERRSLRKVPKIPNLKQNEMLYRSIFENASDAIFLIRNDSILDCNKKSTEVFRCSREQIIGTSPWRFSPENQPDGVSSKEKALMIIKQVQEGTLQHFEWQHSRNDSTLFNAEISLTKFDLEGETYVVSIVRDVSERFRIMIELEKNKVLLERAQHIAKLGFWEIDMSSRKVKASTNAFEIYGVNMTDISLEQIQSFPLPEYRKKMDIALSELITMGKKYDFEFKLKRANDGEIIDIHTLAEYNKNENSVFGIIQDITERIRTLELLQESENRFRILTEATFEGIVISHNEIILDVNDQMLDIFKIKNKADLTNRSIMDFVAPESVESVKTILQNDSVDPYEFIALRTDGTTFFAQIRPRIIETSGNKMRVSALRDITEQKEAERKILNAIIEAEERERNKFSKDLHDGLGPMLSCVKLYMQWMNDTTDDSKRTQIYEKGNQCMTEAFITLKDISNNLSPRILNSLGIVPAIQNFIQQLNDLGKFKIDFEFNSEVRFENNIEITVYRIVSELINNTIKYAEAKNIVIRLGYNSTQNLLNLLYSDNGKGMNLKTVVYQNKGFGLTNINQRIVTLHGSFVMKSSPGNGFMAEIILPVNEKI